LNVTFITATTLVKAVSTIPKLADTDNDQVPDITDNCPNNQNGEVFGTCTQGTGKGSSCMGDIMCGIAVPGPFGGGTPAGDCSMNQEDSDQDGAGDACDPCPHDPLDRCILCSQANPTLPAVYDWRNAAGKNYMTSVKLQNPCGSCWAHAIVGAMEADYNIANLAPSPLDLSEQYLVSDCYTGGNCGGCWPHDALPFVKTNGISDEACYPYTAQNEACNRCAGYASKLWTIDSWTLYEDKGVDFVKKLIFCNGPVGVCNSDHCVIFAGWNNTANSWIIKNSWGAGWGTNGYALKPYTGDAWWSIMKNYAFTVDGTRKK
jgi:C1A family cysteine protease